MNIRYRVELSQAERSKLATLPNAGKHSARKLKRAHILLAAEAGASDADIAISVFLRYNIGPNIFWRHKPNLVSLLGYNSTHMTSSTAGLHRNNAGR
jgi:hypothetical protein